MPDNVVRCGSGEIHKTEVVPAQIVRSWPSSPWEYVFDLGLSEKIRGIRTKDLRADPTTDQYLSFYVSDEVGANDWAPLYNRENGHYNAWFQNAMTHVFKI